MVMTALGNLYEINLLCFISLSIYKAGWIQVEGKLVWRPLVLCVSWWPHITTTPATGHPHWDLGCGNHVAGCHLPMGNFFHQTVLHMNVVSSSSSLVPLTMRLPLLLLGLTPSVLLDPSAVLSLKGFEHSGITSTTQPQAIFSTPS